MGNIQNARIDTYVSSLDLDTNMQGILEQYATKEEIDKIRSNITNII